MKPIAIFYHCLFFRGWPPELAPSASQIIFEQMKELRDSGLEQAAAEIHCGINGSEESAPMADLLLPAKSARYFHGLRSCSENLTLDVLERWLPSHSGWHVLYFHAKGCTHSPGPVLDMRHRWRNCMMRHTVREWRQAVADMDAGFESVGCHWMTPPKTPAGQFIWAGNFWWAKSDFLSTLPSIWKRARIIESGIDAAESRYEAEVWIGNGPRPPTVKDYHPDWDPSKVHTCHV